MKYKCEWCDYENCILEIATEHTDTIPEKCVVDGTKAEWVVVK